MTERGRRGGGTRSGRGLAFVGLLVLAACEGAVDLGGAAPADGGPDRSAIDGVAVGGGDAPPENEAAAPASEAATEAAAETSTPGADAAGDGALDGPSTETGSTSDASVACDGAPDACAAALCADQIKDGLETDVDCGGPVCPGCGPRKGCFSDADCSKTVTGCDAALGCACDAVTSSCVYDHCFDQRTDQDETGPDCGGASCVQCQSGQGCAQDSDCVTNSCDGVSGLCVNNQCIDHRKDGLETDVDCGGSNSCSRCIPGEQCNRNSDCLAGHPCGTGVPQVCQ